MSFAVALVAAIERADVEVASSVPDNWLAPLIQALAASKTITDAPAAREEDALSICCSAALSGVGRFALFEVPAPLTREGHSCRHDRG